jgi:hypothetical protein
MTRRTGRHVAQAGEDQDPASARSVSRPPSPVPAQSRYLADSPSGWAPEAEPRRGDSLTLDREPVANGAGVITEDPASTDDLGEALLPRRVRQANMVPQLRDSGPAGATAAASPAEDPAPAERSPEEVRATMSAIQQGWQLGRSVFDVPDRSGSTRPDDFGTAEPPAPDYLSAEPGGPGSQPGEE